MLTMYGDDKLGSKEKEFIRLELELMLNMRMIKMNIQICMTKIIWVRMDPDPSEI